MDFVWGLFENGEFNWDNKGFVLLFPCGNDLITVIVARVKWSRVVSRQNSG